MNKLIYFLICVAFFSFSKPSDALQKDLGEIVRVNEGLKMAYVKYTASLKKGQPLAVYENGELITYLKVSLITDTIAQLGALDKGPYRTDFTKLKVGQRIVFYDPSKPINPVTSAPVGSPLEKDIQASQALIQQLERPSVSGGQQEIETEVDGLIEQNKRLITHLNLLVNENEALKAKNLSERQEFEQIETQNDELKIQLKQLKEKLNTTINQLEENIKAYEN